MFFPGFFVHKLVFFKPITAEGSELYAERKAIHCSRSANCVEQLLYLSALIRQM